MSKGEALPFLNGVSRFLGYHNRRRIGVATDHVRHDGYVDHTEIRYTVHLKRWVDDGERIDAHLAGAGRVPVGGATSSCVFEDGVREQFVSLTGGPGWEGGKGLKACRGKSPHRFVTQDAEVAAGMIWSIETGAY